jgi:hypothetical protein
MLCTCRFLSQHDGGKSHADACADGVECTLKRIILTRNGTSKSSFPPSVLRRTNTPTIRSLITYRWRSLPTARLHQRRMDMTTPSYLKWLVPARGCPSDDPGVIGHMVVLSKPPPPLHNPGSRVSAERDTVQIWKCPPHGDMLAGKPWIDSCIHPG